MGFFFFFKKKHYKAVCTYIYIVYIIKPCLFLLQDSLIQSGWWVAAAPTKAEWRFSTKASGVRCVTTAGNCVEDWSSVGVWDTKVFKVCIRELILEKVNFFLMKCKHSPIVESGTYRMGSRIFFTGLS